MMGKSDPHSSEKVGIAETSETNFNETERETCSSGKLSCLDVLETENSVISDENETRDKNEELLEAVETKRSLEMFEKTQKVSNLMLPDQVLLRAGTKDEEAFINKEDLLWAEDADEEEFEADLEGADESCAVPS